MTIDLASKLEFLRSLSAFDHVVECIETHMSYVFLTGPRAFKLKKPVLLRCVDQSSVERRRRSCENEARLGLRLAANVYERVVPLVASPHGLALDGKGEVVDWLVVMRRLPADRMLPAMLASGAATPAHADAVAEVLADFYRDAPRAAWDGAAYRGRLRTLITADGDELVARGIARDNVDRIVHALLGFLVAQPRVFEDRIAEGRVIDAHGDLRPEHVCLEQPPVIIDPLEFDDDLRTLDTASELAFFALECERLGSSWFGERVFAGYRERAADRVPAPLAAFYRSQHALTRALLALRHLDDARPADEARWRAKTDDYLERAARISCAVSTVEPPASDGMPRAPDHAMRKMRDIMKPTHWTIRADDTLGTAEWIMAHRRLRHLLVVDGGKLAGFLTDRDVLEFRADSGEQWWRASVNRAMQPIPETAGPDEPVAVARERLAASSFDVLPIVDRGVVIGQVTATDVLEAELWPHQPAPQPTTAGDVMSSPVISVKPTDSLIDAAALMVDHEIRHLPVVDDGHVVGMLSDRDIRTLAGSPERLVEPGAGMGVRALSVRDAMTEHVISIHADRPLKDVAHEFAAERVSALPVVDTGGTLIGIVSYLDALRALA